MGARLEYAKVIDRELFTMKGGKVHPGLENRVIVDDAPGRTAAFLVLRAWRDDHGAITEQWRIEGPGGGVVFESLPREIHLASEGHTEHLEDEVADLDISYVSDDYNLVFLLDEMEVARVRFTIDVARNGSGGAG